MPICVTSDSSCSENLDESDKVANLYSMNHNLRHQRLYSILACRLLSCKNSRLFGQRIHLGRTSSMLWHLKPTPVRAEAAANTWP